jgi:hypothetical protein
MTSRVEPVALAGLLRQAPGKCVALRNGEIVDARDALDGLAASLEERGIKDATAKGRSVPPVPHMEELDRWVSHWVTVNDGKVIAASESSRDLAYQLRKLGSRASGQRRSTPFGSQQTADDFINLAATLTWVPPTSAGPRTPNPPPARVTFAQPKWRSQVPLGKRAMRRIYTHTQFHSME